MIAQIHSWGMFQNKQVFSWDENMEQPWGLGPSHMAALYRASISWMVWDSLLSCPTGMETSQTHFLGKALNDWCFFFPPALIVGKHSFIRFSCRVAQAPGNSGAIALHRHSP